MKILGKEVNWKYIAVAGGIVLLFLLLCSFGLSTSGETVIGLAATVPLAGGGVNVTDEPVSADLTKEVSPDLLKAHIDKEVCRIMPSSTPVDTVSRSGRVISVGSREYEFYSLDTKPALTTLKAKYTETASAGAKLDTANNDYFEVSDTIKVIGVKGYDEGGTTEKDELVLYVMSKDADGKLNVLAVNGKKSGSTPGIVPAIEAGTELLRMGRAGAEKDAQTAQFETLPTKEENYAQKFCTQVEVTDVYQEWTEKEVDFTFSDMERDAIWEMKRGMEMNFLFGKKNKLRDTVKKEDVWFTEGIWWQAGKDWTYDASAGMTAKDLIALCKTALTGNASSKKKLVFAGSDFIEQVTNLDIQKVMQGDQYKAELGLTFDSIHSKFGDLYVVYTEAFDLAGMSKCALVVDDNYLTKFEFKSLSKERRDFKTAGIRETEGEFIQEISGIVLKNPGAHVRITPKAE